MTSPGAEFAFVCDGQVLTRFILEPGEYLIGRAADCEVAIDLDGLGERHAQLFIGERLILQDLGHQSGTFTGRGRLTSTAELEQGSDVQLGTAGILRVEAWRSARDTQAAHATPPAPALDFHVPGAIRLSPPQDKGDRKGKKSKRRQKQKQKNTRSESRIAPTLPANSESTKPPELPSASDSQPELEKPQAPSGPQDQPVPASQDSSPIGKEPHSHGELSPIQPGQTPADPVPLEKSPASPSPAEREKSIDLIDAEIRRLRMALVEEMDRRRRAEKWVNAATETPAFIPELPVQVPQRPRWKLRQKAIAAGALVMAVVIWLGVDGWLRKRAEEASVATHTLSILRPAAEQFAVAAEDRVTEQDWEGACQQLLYALTLAPDQAGWRSRLGDILLARFQFERAVAVYRQAAAADAHQSDAWDGITVCERLLRAREVSGSPTESALYTIHRALVRHGRLAEAVKVAARLPHDVNLQQRTWKERLQKAGLDADVQISDEQKLTVRLRGAVQEKLDLLRGIPAAALWMPETDAHDLTPLTAIPLEELDISRTMVVKLDALRDMPLRQLNLDRTQVEDLLPLRGSPVEELHICHTPVRSIASLRSMPLRKLDISYTRISDLQPLATVPLRELDASGTAVTDLTPLAHLPLATVRLDDTRVVDLGPLQGAPITVLSLARTPITSIEALTQTPIAVLSLSGCSQLRDLTPLSRLRDLQKFILPNAANTKEVQAILPQVRFLE